jgi:hypothetical protein
VKVDTQSDFLNSVGIVTIIAAQLDRLQEQFLARFAVPSRLVPHEIQ